MMSNDSRKNHKELVECLCKYCKMIEELTDEIADAESVLEAAALTDLMQKQAYNLVNLCNRSIEIYNIMYKREQLEKLFK